MYDLYTSGLARSIFSVLLLTNLTFSSEIDIAELCNNRVAIVGRSGGLIGVVMAGRATSTPNKTIQILTGSKDFEFKSRDIYWLEYADGEFKISPKNLRELDGTPVVCFETCVSINYPTVGFFQPGDYTVSSSGKLFRSNLFLLRDDDRLKDRLSSPIHAGPAVIISEIESKLTKVVGSFGQSLDDVVVGNIKFISNVKDDLSVRVEVEGRTRNFNLADCELYRTNELAILRKAISSEQLLELREINSVRLFERLVMVGFPIEFGKQSRAANGGLKFKSQLVLRLEF